MIVKLLNRKITRLLNRQNNRAPIFVMKLYGWCEGIYGWCEGIYSRGVEEAS